ncbi:hypothetical protein G7054_g4040 [Neopestalotiopsis clavispora]|nr:hypothetical protein G7054_g4040 [Neopestalotiopsis clavispora]
MEAVGAAGAIIGLVGSALAGLKSLGEFIAVLQDGEIDLDTTRQRLVEHEFRLSELRTEYDSLPPGFIIPEEKILFDECIKGSHEEVKRYKKLLEKAAKTRMRRTSFQKVETAVRMYLHGEDFKKHRLILQDRTLRLQEFSERSHRIRTTESFQSVMSSAIQHHAEDMAAHTRTADTLQTVSENIARNLQESLNTSLAAEGHITAIMGSYNQETQNLIQASHLSTVQELNESIRCNILPTIQNLFNEIQSSDVDLGRRNQQGAWSQHQRHNGLYTDEFGDSRGIIRKIYWTPFGRLHVFRGRKSTAAESLNADKIGAAYWIKFDPNRLFSRNFVEWRLFLNTGCTGPPTTIWCNVGALCEDVEVIDALGLIHEYFDCSHETFPGGGCLLLEAGCESDNWDDLISDVTRKTFHVMTSHTRYASTDFFRFHSPIKLVQIAAQRSFVTEWFGPAVFQYLPSAVTPIGTVRIWTSRDGVETHLGNLLPHENLFHELEETIFDIGGINALNERFQYDRWLLVLMSYMQPSLRTLMTSEAGNCRKASSWDFSIERVIKEIEDDHEYMKIQVADYLGFNGSLSLLQFVIQKGFDPSALVSPAGRRGSPEIMDLVLQSCLEQERSPHSLDFIHNPFVKLRITQDLVFRARILDLVVSGARQSSHQSHDFDGALFSLNGDAFLVSEMTIGHLMLTGPAEPPEYIRGVAYGSCEDLGRHTSALHQVLQQLLSSSAFGCGLEHVPKVKPYQQEPDIEEYTPLMLALHGGMIPAVKMLVEAGAAIRNCAPCGRSALQLAECNAQSHHPRAIWTIVYWRPDGVSQPQYVSMSADEEMLQILRNALRSRGEEAADPFLSRQDFAKSRWPLVSKVFWRALERIEVFFYWLFSPVVRVSMEDVGERLSYVVVVFTIAFLSIGQLLRLKIDGNLSGGLLRLLSRPVVMIPVVALIIRGLWRHYFVGPEGSEGMPR